MRIVGWTWLDLMIWTCGSWSEGQNDLNFLVQWFCLISWRLFDVCTSYFGSINQYDPTFDLKINVVQWPVFHGPVILPYIWKTIWCMNIIIWDYESVWPKVWPQNKYRSLWPIFHGPVILCYILKTVWCMNIILWDYGSVWPEFDLKINAGLCDLYFMVQWSPRPFDAWVSYFQIMRLCDPNFDFKVNISQHDLYFMV